MSGDTGDSYDFEDLPKTIYEISHRDGSGDIFRPNDSLEIRSLPSYEEFETDITYTRNVQASMMLALDPNFSIDQMPCKDSSSPQALASARNDKPHETISGNTARNKSEKQNVNQVGELEVAPIQWIDLIIILSILLPFVAYIIYKIL